MSLKQPHCFLPQACNLFNLIKVVIFSLMGFANLYTVKISYLKKQKKQVVDKKNPENEL